MDNKQKAISMLGSGALLLSGVLLAPAQEQEAASVAEHPECSFFVKRDRVLRGGAGDPERLHNITLQVSKMLSAPTGRSAVKSFEDPTKFGTIDKYLFADMQANRISPADRTNDFEFIRRVSLDITGRIPTPERVVAFTSDKSADK